LFRFPRPPVIINDKDWRVIVQGFCARDLTKSEDKLPALSGLAKRFSELSNGALGDYRAGLCQNSLHLDILWQRDDAGSGFVLMLPVPHKVGRSRYQGRARAPSWSWAAVGGPIIFRTWPNSRQGGILCETRPVQGHDPFGQIESGTLVIRCPFVMASIAFRDGNPILCYGGGDSLGFWADDPTEIIDLLNHRLASTEHAAEGHKFYCLGISLNENKQLGMKEQLGIVLKSTEENARFLRIGGFYSYNMKFNEADERDFTII
jgi:hypothetical protein